jgi:hypothetical protein
MVETFQDIDLLFDGPDVLFANRNLFHCDETTVIEVNAFVNFAVCTFSYLLNKLIALDGFVLSKSVHCYARHNLTI